MTVEDERHMTTQYEYTTLTEELVNKQTETCCLLRSGKLVRHAQRASHTK